MAYLQSPLMFDNKVVTYLPGLKIQYAFVCFQAEELQAEILELKQQEQKSRVLSEHTTARLERLRSKIIQAVYTAPGAIKPDSKLTDSDILNAVQKVGVKSAN